MGKAARVAFGEAGDAYHTGSVTRGSDEAPRNSTALG